MTADVVAACRQEIDSRKRRAAFEAACAPDVDGRRLGKHYVAALDAFTAILDAHPIWTVKTEGIPRDYCDTCDFPTDYPCPTVAAVAAALGVPVDGQEAPDE